MVVGGLAELKEHGLIDDAKAAAKRVRISSSLADALDGAGFVQENTLETIDCKRAMFADLDRLATPDAILASSTSTIVASLFTESLEGRHRCLVAHPVNPPHLVPLVELVGAPWTAPETIAKAKAIYEALGQVPIVVKREVEGFILNRLQAVLLSEAFRLVEDGYVTPQDLDKTLKDGLGLRWSFMGPFETIELNAPDGIADYCRRYGPSLSRLSAADSSIYDGEPRGPSRSPRACAGETAGWRRLRFTSGHNLPAEDFRAGSGRPPQQAGSNQQAPAGLPAAGPL